MNRSERGFTLLELLIAVSLLAMLMTLLMGGLRVGTHHVARQSERLDHASRGVLVQQFLRTELADARPMSAVGAQRGSMIAFDGRSDGVTFVGPSPASVVTGGLQVLTLTFETDGDARGQLVADWRLYGAPEASVAAGPRRSMLLDHVLRASFAYFGAAPGEAPDWHPRWENMTELPSLVRLSVEFSNGELMPELIVALRLSAGVAGQASLEK